MPTLNLIYESLGGILIILCKIQNGVIPHFYLLWPIKPLLKISPTILWTPCISVDFVNATPRFSSQLISHAIRVQWGRYLCEGVEVKVKNVLWLITSTQMITRLSYKIVSFINFILFINVSFPYIHSTSILLVNIHVKIIELSIIKVT